MIKTETLPDGRTHTWSDAGMRILQTDTGMMYDDAVDQVGVTHIYAETDEPIPSQDGDADEKDYRAALNELGVSTNDKA